MTCHNPFPYLAKLWLSQVDICCSGADFSLSLNPSIAVPLVLYDSRALYKSDYNRLWALACTLFKPVALSHSLLCSHLFACALLHSLLQNPSFFFQLTLSCSFHLYLLPWPYPRTPPPFPLSCHLPAQITTSGPMT